MKSKLYTIFLVNRTQITVCVMFPDECEHSIEEDFREALATTGMLEIEGAEGVLEMIPVSNIMRIHCVPMDDEDEEFNQTNLHGGDDDFDEDDEDDYDEYDEGDELDELDE